jgi:hypothetical protein
MLNQKEKFKIGLIFTLDYEIHGNGSGEFKNWAHLPTAQLLDIFDANGAKLTIMAEMGHYWAMKKYESIFQEDISLFELQLKDAVERGHDVQLHFHPQWIDAKFEEGTWQLDFSLKNTERLCLDYDEAYFYLTKGKTELQKLLCPVNPEYQCVCFRSGFLQMQPSENIIRALLDAGFVSDSSVSMGMKFDNDLISIDYSSANSSYRPWKVLNSDICKSDEAGTLIEFPVFSTYSDIKDKIIKRIGNIKRKKGMDELISAFLSFQGNWMMPEGPSLSFSDKVKLWMNKRWFYVDFCTRDYSKMVKDLKEAINDCKKKHSDTFLPIVLIGHSKDFFFANNLLAFLKACQGIGELEFVTYSEAVKEYSQKKN